jgi:hypothetical protein
LSSKFFRFDGKSIPMVATVGIFVPVGTDSGGGPHGVFNMEVGKKYKLISSPSDHLLAECVEHTKTGNAVLKGSEGLEFIVQKEDSRYWTEVKEPKTGVFWVNVYPDKSVGIYFSSKRKADLKANWLGMSRIACVEVNWTEGDGM